MPIYSVTEINNILSAKIKLEPKFRGLAVRGEMSGPSSDRNGHLYFRLRDGDCSIKAVMFSSSASNLKFLPMEGLAVIAYGSLDYYAHDGSCEIKVTQLIPNGEGAGYAALAKLKERLEKLGIFTAPKRAIPRYPKSIAVVTSPTGAALQDIKNIVARRWPVCVIKVFPTLVQGISAPENIESALKRADKSGCDTIILARGGGSSEDLSAFNFENVVLAVSGCKTPVVSAIGHETDWTLSDLAADLRAPTPSGAAELATPNIEDMLRELSYLESSVKNTVSKKILEYREALVSYEYALSVLSPKEKLKRMSADIDRLEEIIKSEARTKIKVSKQELSTLSEILSSLDPDNILSRGYAIIYKNGLVVPDASALCEGQGITVRMRDAEIGAEVKSVKKYGE